jgi:hypothetical protein
MLWELERVETPPISSRFVELDTLRDLPGWIEKMKNEA